MPDETSDLIDTLYEKENPNQTQQIAKQINRKSPKANIRFLMSQSLHVEERF